MIAGLGLFLGCRDTELDLAQAGVTTVIWTGGLDHRLAVAARPSRLESSPARARYDSFGNLMGDQPARLDGEVLEPDRFQDLVKFSGASQMPAQGVPFSCRMFSRACTPAG